MCTKDSQFSSRRRLFIVHRKASSVISNQQSAISTMMSVVETHLPISLGKNSTWFLLHRKLTSWLIVSARLRILLGTLWFLQHQKARAWERRSKNHRKKSSWLHTTWCELHTEYCTSQSWDSAKFFWRRALMRGGTVCSYCVEYGTWQKYRHERRRILYNNKSEERSRYRYSVLKWTLPRLKFVLVHPLL